MSEKGKDMIVRYDQFKPSADSIKFFEAKPNKNGQGKNVRMTYCDKSLYVQTQKLRNPFGLSKGVEGTAQYGQKFSCTLSFDMSNAKGKAFRKAMEDLQELMIKEAYNKRVEWELGKTKKESRDLTEAEVRRKMTPIVRIPVDKKTGEEIAEFAPTFRVTFNTKNDEKTKEVLAITSEIFDESGTKVRDIDETTIRANSQVKVLMYANSVWVSSAGFGINWRIKQIKVYPSDGLPSGRCLIDEDDEDAIVAGVDSEGDAPAAAAAPAGGDSQDGDGEDTQPAPVQTPPPAETKRLSLKSRGT